MEETKGFRFSITELNQRCDRIVNSFNRDLNEFINYGYTAETATTLEADNTTLKNFLSDEYYQGLLQMATKEKNDIKEGLLSNLVDLRNRYRLCYGSSSVDYKLLKLAKVALLSDEETVQKALHTCQVCETRLDVLNSRMVTQETLDEIMSQREQLDLAIDNQASAVTTRREMTLGRTKLANEIYQKLSEICEVGKLIWKDRNEALYLDYVLYGSSKPMAEIEENEELS